MGDLPEATECATTRVWNKTYVPGSPNLSLTGLSLIGYRDTRLLGRQKERNEKVSCSCIIFITLLYVTSAPFEFAQ